MHIRQEVITITIKSLYIHNPQRGLSTSENLLQMIRPDSKYTRLEAEVLDLALVLHAEHGGGNNSSFTVHVVTSTGTDTYSAIAAAIGALKGQKHGGCKLSSDGYDGRHQDPYSKHTR